MKTESTEITYEYSLEQLSSDQILDIPIELKNLYDNLPENKKDVFRYALNLFINKLNLSPKTAYRNVLDIFDETESKIEFHHNFIYDDLSKSKRIIEIGCGWGNFLQFLSSNHCFDTVYAIDYVIEHVVSTKLLNKDATVIRSDACDMNLVPSDFFDFVILRGVIEHIGDHNIPIGKSGKNIKHQYKAIQEISRVLKQNGKLFLSTGNYLFPRDGEIHTWLYHWLPDGEKKKYNIKKGITPDKYWLLNWEELIFILHSCGLSIEKVICPIENNPLAYQMIESLDKSMIELDEDMKKIWRRLIEVDPHFFPNWNIIARKSSPDEEIKIKDNLCYNARINGDSCNLLLENEILKQKICGYNIPILSYFIKKQISLSELISKKINFR